MKEISKIMLAAFLSCTLLLGGTTAMAQTREAAANTAAQSLFTKNDPTDIKSEPELSSITISINKSGSAPLSRSC